MKKLTSEEVTQLTEILGMSTLTSEQVTRLNQILEKLQSLITEARTVIPKSPQIRHSISEEDFGVILGNNVRRQRKLLGLRQRQLADMIRKRRDWVTKVENCRQGIYAHDLFNLANALGITMDDLIKE